VVEKLLDRASSSSIGLFITPAITDRDHYLQMNCASTATAWSSGDELAMRASVGVLKRLWNRPLEDARCRGSDRGRERCTAPRCGAGTRCARGMSISHSRGA